MKNFIGIDFGAKLAGSTAVTFAEDGKLFTLSSLKGKDADDFLYKYVQNNRPEYIFIDAPLSLPLAYFGGSTDYFYRSADRALKAMSPMFLGGLTARAMAFKASLLDLGISCVEVYPAALVRFYPELKVFYDKKNTKQIAPFIELLKQKIPETIVNTPSDWHQVDSILAWYTGFRFFSNSAVCYGENSEGLIWV